MRQFAEEVKRLAGILGSSLDTTVIHEDFGQVVVRLEAREVSDRQLESLQKIASAMPKANGDSARLAFDAVSRRIYYYLPERDAAGCVVEVRSLRDALRQAGVKVLNGR